jgi:hypothetical protein
VQEVTDIGTIVERGQFHEVRDIVKLNIIDWKRLNGLFSDQYTAMERVGTFLMSAHASYAICKIRLSDFPERDDWTGWRHVGMHEQTGKLYWNFFRATQQGELAFSDEPDFYGNLFPPYVHQVTPFWGDIGVVSVSTFAHALSQMQRGHNLWISVEEDVQTVIEVALGSELDCPICRADIKQLPLF